MSEISEGRVVELINPTKDQRKAVGKAVSAIKTARGLSFEKIYARSHGTMADFKNEDEKNLNKGIIAQKKATAIFRWIVENQLPLACEVAPEVFDPSLLTRWWDFVYKHNVYEKLRFEFPDEFGLTARSSKQPIADTPIPLGQDFLLLLDCNISGALLTLEVHNGKTYPMALHHDESSVVLNIEAGKHMLPQLIYGSPEPLSETHHEGLRSYIFILAHQDIVNECAKGLAAAHPVGLDKLDQIAFAFEGIDPYLFEVHRLNVIFTD